LGREEPVVKPTLRGRFLFISGIIYLVSEAKRVINGKEMGKGL